MICHVSPNPTPLALLHVAVVCAVVTEQLVAVYPVPYVAETPPVGPKFVPVSVTVVPPAVGNAAPPAILAIAGGVYDTVWLDTTLACDPTVTIHVKPAPTPTIELHVIVVSATVTVQLVAVYVVPVAPYVAAAGFAGPKLVPVIVIVVPPLVGIDAPPAIPVIAGGT